MKISNVLVGVIIGLAIGLTAGVFAVTPTNEPSSDSITGFATPYGYMYALSPGQTCDMHWLRPRLYYEMGKYPDEITIVGEEVYIGFYNELSSSEKTQLDSLMSNPSNLCNKPSASVEFSTRIHPEQFEQVFSSTGFKPMYYADENANVKILILDQVDNTTKTNMEEILCGMWTTTVN